MAIEINTKVSSGETYGKKLGNLILEDAKFFGRPNFAGEEDRFKDSRRKFTVLIPNELADQLREMGWNVKTMIPTPEEKAEGREDISFIKVMVDMAEDPTKGSQVFIKQGDDLEKLTPATVGLIDRARFDEIGMEIRAWEYNEEEVKAGLEEPKYSARLVQFVGVMRPNLLEEKYGKLR